MARSVNLSTIGVKFGWAIGTVETKPSAFTQIEDCVSIDGIDLSTDTIDCTPLEAKFREYVDGIKDTGGAWGITFNIKDSFVTAWEALRTASAAAKAENKIAWACIWVPGFSKSFYVQFYPGEIPLPEFSVGSAFQGAVSNTIAKYIGLDTAVEPSKNGG